MNIKLTVFFEEPFWVGVFEKTEDSLLETSRVVFGPEPRDYEVYFFVLENYYKLPFSRPVYAGESAKTEKINPKRLQRIVQREMKVAGIGTKAQQAIKLEYEARKQENRQIRKEKREEQERILFEKKQQKKKEKKKGH
jgi:hypothetical protein